MAHSAAVMARFRAPRFANNGPDAQHVGRAGARAAGVQIEIHLDRDGDRWRARFRAYGDPAAIAAADWVAEALDGSSVDTAEAPAGHVVARALELPASRQHCADLAGQAAAAALADARGSGSAAGLPV